MGQTYLLIWNSNTSTLTADFWVVRISLDIYDSA